jgi:inner membrane protein
VLQRNEGPSAIAWLIALISLALPWIGIGAGLVGVWTIGQGDRSGWWLVGAGAAILVADVLIDFVWAHPSVSTSDLPDLNRRANQIVGRVLLLEEAIEGGRGKVRVGDTLWLTEGPELPAGSRVKVTSAKRDLLVVEQVPEV